MSRKDEVFEKTGKELNPPAAPAPADWGTPHDVSGAPWGAPAPAVCDGGTCGLGGYCTNCPRLSAAPAVPLTDEQFADIVAEASLAVDLAANPLKLLAFARAVLSAAPVVREPLTFEQRRAIQEAHCNDMAQAYFSARPQLNDKVERRIYEAGFNAGYGIGGGGNG